MHALPSAKTSTFVCVHVQVDAALNAHIMELRRLAGIKDHAESSWGLLPPQLPQHKVGAHTVFLVTLLG